MRKNRSPFNFCTEGVTGRLASEKTHSPQRLDVLQLCPENGTPENDFSGKTTDRQKGKNSASVVLYKGKYQTLSSIYRKYEMQWIRARQVFSRRDGPIPNVLFLNTQHYIAAPTLQAPLAASAVSFPWTVTEYNWVLFSSFLICINFMFVYQISIPM